MSGHTPGPWESGSTYDVSTRLGAVNASGDRCKESERWQIADCSISRRLDYIEQEANARLIAAAPELLEALQDLVSIAESAMRESGEWQIDDELQDARAAIAKATGVE